MYFPTVPGRAAVALSWLFSLGCNLEICANEAAPKITAELVATTEPDWPQFRGRRRDGHTEEHGLLQSWPAEGPRVFWRAKSLGRGFSSPLIVKDVIYLTGDVGEDLHLFALNSSDGKLLWKQESGRSWKDPYPGARTTPTYSAGKIYLENAHGEIRCFDATNGTVEWSVNLLQKFRGKNLTWGMSECLLVDDRAVYATAGGTEALVVALDKKTGATLWQSGALHDTEGDRSVESASYVSPILVQFAGKRLLIGCSLRHLFCLDADNGVIQWTRRVPTAYSVLAMMPTLVGDSIFMTAPHGKPGALYQLLPPAAPGEKIGFEQKWETKLDTCQGGVVHVGGKLIGSFYPGRKGWAAVDTTDGAVLYSAEDIVKGAVLYADQRLYVLSENGWMHLLEPTEREFAVRGRFRLAQADNDAWAHPVVLHGRMYLRYHDELFVYDVRASGSSGSSE